MNPAVAITAICLLGVIGRLLLTPRRRAIMEGTGGGAGGGEPPGKKYFPFGVDLQKLPASMHEAHTLCAYNQLRSLPLYKAAKEGLDFDAAAGLIGGFASKIPMGIIKKAGVDCVVPMSTRKGKSKNAIPYVLAKHIARNTGARIAQIVSARKPGRMKVLTLAERAGSRVEFHIEPIVKGRRVLIVDDIYTTGTTALAAVHAVERAGGRPVMVFALSHGGGGNGIKPRPAVIASVLDRLGLSRHAFFNEYRYEIDQITDAALVKCLQQDGAKGASRPLRGWSPTAKTGG
jgi:predicted amidophosphoribosyltransferase